MDALVVSLIGIVATALLTGAVAWAAWVSKMLIELKAASHGVIVTQKDHEERLAEMERLLPRHIPFPTP